MIVCDTNVLSELLRTAPDPAVLAWAQAHKREATTTSITLGELHYGALRLPQGRRRDQLLRDVQAIDATISQLLPFDRDAAHHYADLRAAREAGGRRVGNEDVMIAAIARSRGHSVATRNVQHFDGYGVEAINPWKSGSGPVV